MAHLVQNGVGSAMFSRFLLLPPEIRALQKDKLAIETEIIFATQGEYLAVSVRISYELMDFPFSRLAILSENAFPFHERIEN